MPKFSRIDIHAKSACRRSRGTYAMPCSAACLVDADRRCRAVVVADDLAGDGGSRTAESVEELVLPVPFEPRHADELAGADLDVDRPADRRAAAARSR